MPKRTCAVCGKEKDVSGAKVCEKGHFVCYRCVHASDTLLSTSGKSKCPLCKTKLK